MDKKCMLISVNQEQRGNLMFSNECHRHIFLVMIFHILQANFQGFFFGNVQNW